MKLAAGACRLFDGRDVVAERGHFVPGALDRGMDQAELVLEDLSLGDLRPRPLQRIAVDASARPDQVAQRLQLRHELAMPQRAFHTVRGNILGGTPARVLLDPKDLALNRHRGPLLRGPHYRTVT